MQRKGNSQEKNIIRVRLLILLCVTLVAYVNSLTGDFQFDDYNVIVFNSNVHSLASWAESISGIRPLLKLSFTFNWISGWGQFGFHFVNTLIHIVNTILVYLLSRCLISKSTELDSYVTNNTAFVVALLFALHPIQTEAVTYISSRSTSMMTLFYLGSLYAYNYGRTNGSIYWLYIVSPLFFLFSVLTKETALTLPFALLLWERFVISKQFVNIDILRFQFLHWLSFGLIILIVLHHPIYLDLLTVSFSERDIYHNLLTQLNGVTYLLSRLIWVHKLNIDPDLPVLTQWSLVLLVEAIFFLILLVIGLMSSRRHPWLSFGILWFFLHLIPTNSFIPRLDVVNERHLYLVNFGIFLLIAGSIAVQIKNITAFQKMTITLGVISILVVLTGFTIARNEVFSNQISLWEDTVKKSPKKARVHNNLGFSYALEGHFDKARSHYLQALRLKPNYTLAFRNLTTLNKLEKTR